MARVRRRWQDSSPRKRGAITNIQVEDPGEASASKLGEQKGMIRQGPDRNRELSAITEEFVIRVRIPVTVEYEIFGLQFTLNEKWDVTRPPTDTTWTFPTWGITAATTPGETVTLSENAITLDGVAQINDSTLIVITHET